MIKNISSNIKEKIGKKEEIEIIIVKKENYHLSFLKFKENLSNPKCKFVFFNVELSNVKFLTEKLHLDLNNHEENFLSKFINEINKIKKENPQIIFTEFLICKESKKEKNKFELITFLIPSLKFYKFNEKESLLTIDSDTLSYLNFYKENYPFNLVCNTNTISYMNFEETEKIYQNYERILEEGKPTKNENSKAYYFYPKNILMPTKETKIRLEDLIEHIMAILKDRKTLIEEETSTANFESHSIQVDNNYFIVEKLINFDWRLLLNPFDKNLIRTEINNVTIKLKNKIIIDKDKNTLNYFNKFCEQINLFLTHEFYKNIKKSNFNKDNFFTFNNDNEFVNDDFFLNWRNFLEYFFEHKILIITNFKKKEIVFNFRILKNTEEITDEKFLQLIQIIKSIKSTFDSEEDCKIKEENLFRVNKFLSVFNISNLFPNQIHSYLELIYNLNINIDTNFLKKVRLEDIKIKFENLFLNLNNEKEILFDYNLEKELYIFIEELKSEIGNHILDQSKKIISINDDIFFKDFSIFCNNKEIIIEIENLFKNKIKIIKTDNKNNIFITFVNESKEEITQFYNYFKENDKKIRYELIRIFLKFKKQNFFEEEFGTANFFKYLLDSKNNISEFNIIGCNLLMKFIVIYLEMFSKADNISLQDFISFINGPSFIDLNYLCKHLNKNFMKELSKISTRVGNNNLNVIKLFNIFKEIKLENDNMDMNFYQNKFIQSSNDNIIIFNSKGEIIKENIQKNETTIILKLKNEDEKLLDKFIYKNIIQICQDYGDFMVYYFLFYF